MWFLLLVGVMAHAQELPLGRVIEEVKCAAEPSQSYALYVPSGYTPSRPWPVVFAFDPGARGLQAAERFSKGAEKYGYIVAASRNSRNGSMEGSMIAARAMWMDVDSRFAIDPKRVYTAGMSGGSRVAMQIALATKQIAGVLAASAGYPDSQPRKTLGFLVYATAGREDFNRLEMRELDQTLKSAHHLAIFDGSHVWPSPELVTAALEWFEVQAMKAGTRPRDEKLIASLLDARTTEAAALTDPKDRFIALTSLAADFEGLAEVGRYAVQATDLERQKAVKEGLKKDRAEDAKEKQTIFDVVELERGLLDQASHSVALGQLRDKLTRLAKQASTEQDSVDRRLARRVLRGFFAGGSERMRDAEYRKLIEQLRTQYPAIGSRNRPQQ